MRRLSLLLLVLLSLTACRREDWKTARFTLPEGLPPAEAVARIAALDPETPPQITVEGSTLTVRYNTLHLASKNITYVLENTCAF